MHRRTWDAQTNARIVLQGLQGKPVAELCNEYQISQSLLGLPSDLGLPAFCRAAAY
jgi:hypothetical protein